MSHGAIVLALLTSTTGIARAGEHDSSAAPTLSFHPACRSVQLDGTVFLNYAYGGSVDVDFLRFRTGRRSSLGIRLGIERFSTGGAGGGGSLKLDYNALLRTTLAGEVFRFDVFLGYARHTSDHPQHNPAESLVKYGAEPRWKVAPGIFGMLLKANGTTSAGIVGIGLYAGWDQ